MNYSRRDSRGGGQNRQDVCGFHGPPPTRGVSRYPSTLDRLVQAHPTDLREGRVPHGVGEDVSDPGGASRR